LSAQVQLIPQLIINYKLKSVAHMPIKAMIYKTLSTVVDDFFAYAYSLRIRGIMLNDFEAFVSRCRSCIDWPASGKFGLIGGQGSR
jgi:hypothetical protein